MATIRKRGNLQWEVRIRRKGWPTTSKTFETKSEADIWARKIEGEMDHGTFVSRTEAEGTTLAEALERYIDEYIPKLAQVKREKNRALALKKRDIACRFLASIRGKDIADFIKEREKEGVGANTIRLDLAMLSRIFELAVSDWGMESLSNPVKKVNKPKAPKGRTRRLEEGEEEKLLKASPLPFRQVVHFALETAMRREEISRLTWHNVNMEKRSAYLPKTKNGEERTVPLSPAALDILREMLAEDGDNGWVFCMSPDAITQAMEAARKSASLENLTFHDLRHEATSRLFENTDLDVMEIKTITGHRSMQMLARYSHLRAHRLAARLAGAKRGENNTDKK
jgi:Site-specific recombinase XerD